MIKINNNQANDDLEQCQDPHAPGTEILQAFNISGTPVNMPGGSGQIYRVKNTVLKPAGDEVLMSWLADITENLTNENFRIAKPIRSQNSDWIYQGWIANEFLEGFHKNNAFEQFITISKDFHKAVSQIPKPAFYDQLDGPFHQADKMTWGEMPLPDYDLINKPLKKLFDNLKPNQLPNQLIHGDWGYGNMLFHPTLKPAVIDITPYFRPADLPIAGMMIHAILEGANPDNLLPLAKNIKDFDQLLLRAVAKEILQWVNFQLHPENDHDRSPEILKRVALIDLILEKIRQHLRP